MILKMGKNSKLEKGLRREWKNIIFNLAFAILSLLIVIFYYQNIILTTSLLLILAIIGMIKWKSKITFILFVVGGLFGTISEMTAIYTTNVWFYALPNILNLVPLWLFILWGNTAAFLFETGKEIKKLGVKDD